MNKDIWATPDGLNKPKTFAVAEPLDRSFVHF